MSETHRESLAGRVALITGGASGIGFGMAEAFAAAGMKVALADVDEQRAYTAAATLPVPAIGCGLDVRDRTQWAKVVRRCESELGPVYILCNNAGVTSHDPLVAMAAENWDWLIGVNLTGVWNGVHTCAAGMSERGAGHIVNTASTAGLHVPRAATVGAYSASKAAVVALSEALRYELAPRGVGVSVLCPGLVGTRIRETAAKLRPVPAAGSGSATLDVAAPPAVAARPTGSDPRKVGVRVLTGILRNEPYIITHPSMRHDLETRLAELLDCYREPADTSYP